MLILFLIKICELFIAQSRTNPFHQKLERGLFWDGPILHPSFMEIPSAVFV